MSRAEWFLAVAALVALPSAAAGTISVDRAVSEDGTYTVSWTESACEPMDVHGRKIYLESSVAGGPWSSENVSCVPRSRYFSAQQVGAYSYRIRSRSYAKIYSSYIPIDTYSNSVTSRVTNESYYVGVLSGSATCPNGVPTVSIFMDTEDDTAATGIPPASAAIGWTGASWVDNRNNVNLSFCRVDGTRFLPLTSTPDQAKEYAVLKLGSRCPAGSVEFGRMFDNEDTNNLNHNSGNIAPSYQDRNTMMRFCLFRYAANGAPTMQPDSNTGSMFPSLGFAYGVFAASTFYYAISGATGSIRTDDEDTNTSSFFDIPATLDVTSVYRIIDGFPHFGGNTTMNTALVSYE